MTAAGPANAIEAEFEKGIDTDAGIRLWCNVVTLALSIATPVILLVLIIPLGRTSPWLVLLSLYSIYTRGSMFIASAALLFPRFLLALDDEDPARREAARRVLERRRAEVVRPILKAWMKPHDDNAVAAFPVDELARMARERDIPKWRRIAIGWFAAWVVLSILIWGTVVATGGGPTN